MNEDLQRLKDLRIEQLMAMRGNYLKQREKELESHKFGEYRRNPLKWLTERFGESETTLLWDAWDKNLYRRHNWDGTKNPIFAMWQALADGKWVGVMSGTGTGKTYILARIVLWYMDCFENALVVTSAPKEDQLKKHLWSEVSRAFHKFKAIRPDSQLNKLILYGDVKDEHLKDSWIATGFVAGVNASEESTTKAQGFHRENMLIIMEEAAGMPHPTMNAFVATSTGSNNLVMAVGNPDSKTDTLSQFLSTNPDAEHVTISSLDHPNIVLKEDVVAGAASPKSIKRLEHRFGKGSPMYNSRVRGICPDQSSNSLIKLEWVKNSFISELEGFDKFDHSSNAVGVDVANSVYGDAGGVCYGKANVVTSIKEFVCPSASHLAYNLLYGGEWCISKGYNDYEIPTIGDMEIHEENVGVDTVGLGVSCLNTFEDEGYSVFSIQGGVIKDILPKDKRGQPLYNFKSLRQQGLWLLREDLQHGNIHIKCEDNNVRMQIERELTVVAYKLAESTITIESKENIKKKLGGKSPTYLDVLWQWNLARKDVYQTDGAMPFL